MQLSDYDFELPESMIAQQPLADRAASRLLVLPRDGGPIQHRIFREIDEYFREGDLLIRNATRVSAVRLFGHKQSGGAVEVLVLTRLAEHDTYEALAKPAKRLPPGTLLEFEHGLRATVRARHGGGSVILHFEGPGDVHETLVALGSVPLPPYIRESLADSERYQTVYAREPGSAAAPTAGLHFTPEIFAKLQAKGVSIAEVTLDVGIDTFRPLAVEDPREHEMHGEWCEMPESTAEAIAHTKGRIIAVGTTTTRTVESFAVGVKKVRSARQKTKIFIYPGYEFKVVDGLITNFHMPRTSMLLMLAALTGRERLMQAYSDALARKYRFLSFGDAMLIV